MSREESLLQAPGGMPYCKGCGHPHVLRRLGEALASLDLPPHRMVLTTDIGCHGLADSLFPRLHTVHTTHGRSTAFATGLALAAAAGPEQDPLKPVVLIGDGGATIGLLHLVHAAQLNVDVTVVVHNNFVFGMTGGQHSGLTPEGLHTRTTPAGSPVPPLDLVALLEAAGAPFAARVTATDAQLGQVLAQAVSDPGFAVVEVLELCPVHVSRHNRMTGAVLSEMAGSRTGVEAIRRRPRQPFAARSAPGPGEQPAPEPPAPARTSRGAGPEVAVRLVLAGRAGERVQSAATLLCEAAVAAGLYATQKNDNPVTQGTGFSLSELALSGRPIGFTGMEHPDAVIVTAEEGLEEVRANGTLERCRPDTLVLVDEELAAPGLPAGCMRLPLRKGAGDPRRAALAGLMAWQARTGVLPMAAWDGLATGLDPSRREEVEKALAAVRQWSVPD